MGVTWLRLCCPAQHLDSLFLAHEVGPHAGQHITHEIIVADRADISAPRRSRD
ncbi:dihydroneopterin aldolase [Cutibacterium sp.]|uniref:dihydroneopterin aldolase n=1 Tax=Cutibacterium sp. TaxID=1912221 RepID=UPI0026DCF096|nr:dihydroneopterin aldolase [Cutibacterium sp.]MDO4412734.1 dihydroneopterin aldolase [Cutibacterium sp.]